MKRTNSQKGITLIALIITIVVLLILAVVAIRAVQGDGIIQYAQNARDEYQTKADEEQEIINGYLSQIGESTNSENKNNGEGSENQNPEPDEEEGTGSSSQITWTKTSTGDLAVGSTVVTSTGVTSTGENFYVIGFKNNNETVVLLAKYNLKADGSAQDTGAVNGCAFSKVENLDFTNGENLNNNSTVKEDTTSAVYKAMQYGETLGVTTGRLMTLEEVLALGGSRENYSTRTCNTNGNAFVNSVEGNSLDYWLGTSYGGDTIWRIFR